jgi:hypothetical protein
MKSRLWMVAGRPAPEIAYFLRLNHLVPYSLVRMLACMTDQTRQIAEIRKIVQGDMWHAGNLPGEDGIAHSHHHILTNKR